MIAITREVPASLEKCELTHQARVSIDVPHARREHEAYERALHSLGCTIQRLPALPDCPDSVFVEDIAVVFDEIAVVTRPGALSRRPETESMRCALQELLTVSDIVGPGTMDGGDVLRVGRRVFVGISTRTNQAGAAQLAAILKPFGFSVMTVQVNECLHLKSAATAVTESLVVVNPAAVSPDMFGVAWLTVPPSEWFAANVLAVGETVLCSADAPETAQLLEHGGFNVMPIENSELAKAEAGLTCCSVLVTR